MQIFQKLPCQTISDAYYVKCFFATDITKRELQVYSKFSIFSLSDLKSLYALLAAPK